MFGNVKNAVKSVVGKVISWFKTPAPSPIPMGRNPPITKSPTAPVVSQGDFVTDFLYFGKKIIRPSSNVEWCQFQFDQQRPALIVAYQNGAVWEYTGSSMTVYYGESLARAASSGIWIWDRIRVRGKGNKKVHQAGIVARKIS